MKKNIFFTAFLFLGFFMGINAQNYYIEGFYERHGEGEYSLKNVHTNGIYIDGETSLTEKIWGSKEHITCDGIPATMVQFPFEKATTDCPTKWDNGFVFQYWDEDNNKWKTDVEACRGKTTSYSQKDMVIMLVLDYSGSMQNNISRLQSSAINFINSVSDISDGNVHVGIIAFSGMDLAKNQVFPITPLSKDNKYQFERFIRDSQKGKETALYYSMDKAIQMMENYVRNKRLSADKYNGACMITFTDGLDNASINDEISTSMHRGRKNEYLSYLSEKLSGPSRKSILGIPVENFAIGFTGSEDFSREDKEFFREVLQKTTPDKDHLILSSDFKDVERYFNDIIKKLTERWETLNMYVGESQHGRVRWVLNCGKKKVYEEPKEREQSKLWLGIGLEAGMGMGYFRLENEYRELVHVGVRADATWPLSNWFAIGGTATLGISHGNLNFRLGPLMKYTFTNGAAIIAGAGFTSFGDENITPYMSLGLKFKSPWYINASLNALSGESGGGFGYSFGIGYSIIGGK